MTSFEGSGIEVTEISEQSIEKKIKPINNFKMGTKWVQLSLK